MIDWVNGCTGPPGIDVARYRLNLALDHGMEEADAFRLAYRAAAGPEAADHPHWDVVDAVDAMPYYDGPDAVAAWPSGEWPATARDRVELFLASALAEL